MDGKIVFCKDGILRFKSDYDDEKIIPMVLIQDVLENTTAKTFLQMLKRNAIVEAGSTIGSFILCLEPWAEHAKDYIDRDVVAYIKEIRKPSASENAFDKIELSKSIHIGRELDYGKMPEDMDFIDWLNSDKDPEILNKFSIEINTGVCGYNNEDASNYSMSCTSIQEIKNVPFIINKKTHIVEYCDSRTKEKGYIMNTNTEGVHNINKMMFVETKDDNYYTFESLIDAVFCDGLFYYSPSGSEHTKEILNDIVEDIKEREEAKNNENNLKENDEDNKKREIKIADGAFSSIISHSMAEKEEWLEITSKLKNNSRYPIRIGKIEEDVPEDNRLYGMILDENNNVIKTMDDKINKED